MTKRQILSKFTGGPLHRFQIRGTEEPEEAMAQARLHAQLLFLQLEEFDCEVIASFKQCFDVIFRRRSERPELVIVDDPGEPDAGPIQGMDPLSDYLL